MAGKVYVATYSDRDCTDIRVFRNYASTQKWRSEIATEFWVEQFQTDSMPVNLDERADLYFGTVRDQDEYFWTAYCDLED